MDRLVRVSFYYYYLRLLLILLISLLSGIKYGDNFN